MNPPHGYHSMSHGDGAFPGEPMHHPFYPASPHYNSYPASVSPQYNSYPASVSPQYNSYVPHPTHQHLVPNSPLSYAGEHDLLMREQEQRLQRHNPLSPTHIPLHHSSLPGWECLQCCKKFYSEAEREQHLLLYHQQEQTPVPDDLFYESIDSPRPIVQLIWTKERQTLEKEVQLFTKEGEVISLMWSDQDKRFQAETRLSVGEHDGLLSVNDNNLSAEVHSFYVAQYQINSKTQIIELAINDEAEELKRREEPVPAAAAEENEDKGEAEKKKKSKSRDLIKKLSRTVDNNHEADRNARDGDAKKQMKHLQKENEKLSADCSKYKKQLETLNRDKEAKREQLEGEKLVLKNTISALKRELELKQSSALAPANMELTAALGRSKSQLDVRDKENTDLSQQLDTLQMITSCQQNQLRDQQEEIDEKRESIIELEANLLSLNQELDRKLEAWQLESEEYKNKLNECNVKSELELDQVKKELNKSQIICESLKERLSEAAQQRGELENSPDARTAQARVLLALSGGGGEETEVQTLKGQLQMVEKERDELVLVNKALEIDLENLRERFKLGNESKSRQQAPQDPEISKFFQNTIKRKEEELEETKQSLKSLREQNLRLERDKQVCLQQLESYKDVIIPGLQRQIHDLVGKQLTPVGSYDIGCSLTSNCEEAQLLSPISAPVELVQQLGLNGTTFPTPIPMVQTCSIGDAFKTNSSLTANSPAPDLSAAPSISVRELPLPKHMQKRTSCPK